MNKKIYQDCVDFSQRVRSGKPKNMTPKDEDHLYAMADCMEWLGKIHDRLLPHAEKGNKCNLARIVHTNATVLTCLIMDVTGKTPLFDFMGKITQDIDNILKLCSLLAEVEVMLEEEGKPQTSQMN